MIGPQSERIERPAIDLTALESAATRIAGEARPLAEKQWTWLRGPSPLSVSPEQLAVYDGAAGVAWYLCLASQALRDSRFLEDALALTTTCASLTKGRQGFPGGFYSGGLGIGFVTTLVGATADQPAVTGDGLRLIEDGCRRILETTECDVISGAAGAIPFLLHLATVTQGELPFAVACRLAEHVLKHARRTPHGWYWDGAGLAAAHPLIGFAHGGSGVARGLLSLAAANGDDELVYAAEQALHFESHFFDASRGTWCTWQLAEVLDAEEHHFQRELGERLLSGEELALPAPKYPVQWCYGAAGMAAVREDLHALTGDPLWSHQASLASRATWESLATGTNYSLCHGAFGNADQLLEIARHPSSHNWRPVVEEWAQFIPSWWNGDRGGWRSGSADGLRSSSLLLGDAGIGYLLLRLISPEVPSVLGPRISSMSLSKPSDWRRPFATADAQRAFPVTSFAARALLGHTIDFFGDEECRFSQPLTAAYDSVCKLLSKTEGTSIGAALADAAAVELAVLQCSSEAVYLAPENVEWLARRTLFNRWSNHPTVHAPGLVKVTQQYDWGSWLAADVEPPVMPQEKTVTTLVYPCRGHVETVVAATTDILEILSAFAEPVCPSELIREAQFDLADGSSLIAAQEALGRVIRQLYNAGAIVPDVRATLSLRENFKVAKSETSSAEQGRFSEILIRRFARLGGNRI
ncbi:MAG: lanthionine synthetase LanC family protein [Gemmatimonadaceae bacterium]